MSESDVVKTILALEDLLRRAFLDAGCGLDAPPEGPP